VSLRDAGPADAAAVARIQVASWRAAYAGLMPDEVLAGLSEERRREHWETLLAAGPPAFCLLAGSPPVGFVAAGTARLGYDGDGDGDGDGHGQVYAIYVDPEHWGRGHGGALLAAAVERLRAAGSRRVTLWVLTTNLSARAFYERAGWSATGLTRTETMPGAELHETEYATELT
jgi:ribosomal protein S18 acetylase RimI-like enzyme